MKRSSTVIRLPFCRSADLLVVALFLEQVTPNKHSADHDRADTSGRVVIEVDHTKPLSEAFNAMHCDFLELLRLARS